MLKDCICASVYQVCGLKELLLGLSVPQFPQRVEQWHQHSGTAGALPGGDTCSGPGRGRATPPCTRWALGDPGFLAPSSGHSGPHMLSCPVQAGQSCQEGSRKGSQDPWDSGSPSAFRASHRHRCRHSGSSSTWEFVRDAHPWPPAQTPRIQIWGRARQSDLTRPPDNSEAHSDLGASARNIVHFIQAFKLVVITLWKYSTHLKLSCDSELISSASHSQRYSVVLVVLRAEGSNISLRLKGIYFIIFFFMSSFRSVLIYFYQLISSLLK